MLSYSLIKTLHIVCAFVFVALATLVLRAKTERLEGAVFALSSVMTVIFGTFLIGILKVGFPIWILVKFLLWCGLMALVGVTRKRFPKKTGVAVCILYVVVSVIIVLAVYKPEL